MKNYTTNQISRLLGLIAMLAMAFFVAAPIAHAGDQDFTLINKTGVEIHALHVSPHSSDDWADDILGADTLENGKSLEIKFSRKARAHHWDLRIEDEKGNSVTWENLDLTTISELTLHLKDGKAWADIK
jgi:hypothetical protein